MDNLGKKKKYLLAQIKFCLLAHIVSNASATCIMHNMSQGIILSESSAIPGTTQASAL